MGAWTLFEGYRWMGILAGAAMLGIVAMACGRPARSDCFSGNLQRWTFSDTSRESASQARTTILE